MKVCVYTIALNEEKHVMRWLEATKDADVRVVADTGSTDKTVQLLQGAPNVIVHQITVKPFRFDVRVMLFLLCYLVMLMFVFPLIWMRFRKTDSFLY